MPPRLDPGAVFSRVVAVYRAQASLLLPAGLLVLLPPALLLTLGAVLELAFVALLGVMGLIVAQFWLQGMAVEAVRDMLDDRRDLTLEALLGAVPPVLGPLVAAGLLAGVATLAGAFALLAPGLFLLTIWALIAPVIVVERRPAMESFGRSRALVRGNGWPVLGVVLTAALASALVVGLAQTLGARVGGEIGSGAARLVATVLLAPLVPLSATVMYFTLAGRPDAAGPGSPSSSPAAEEADAQGVPSGWAPPRPPER